MRALIVGWFSYEGSDATAGDLLASDLVRTWLADAGWSVDVAQAAAFAGGVRLSSVRPSDYDVVVFVCGPFMRNHWEADFFAQFADHRIIGVNLSLPVPLGDWNLFDALVERDSDRRANPDVTFASPAAIVPVVGLCLVEPYAEANVDVANTAITALCESREMAIVPIDTRLDVNRTGLRTSREVESVIARMDAMVTTRLHGMVLALKHGVPALVIDPEPNGGRIARQAATLGWPFIFTADHLEAVALQRALGLCLSEATRDLAQACAVRAVPAVERIRREFTTSLPGAKLSPLRAARLAFARQFGR